MPDLHPLSELTTAEAAHFIAEGWLLVRGLIPAEAVTELVPRILERVADDGSEWGGFLLKDSPRGGAAERIYSPRYARVLADLCGPGATIGMDGPMALG